MTRSPSVGGPDWRLFIVRAAGVGATIVGLSACGGGAIDTGTMLSYLQRQGLPATAIDSVDCTATKTYGNGQTLRNCAVTYDDHGGNIYVVQVLVTNNDQFQEIR